MIETSDTIRSVHLIHKSLRELHEMFLDVHRPIDAAGGVVINEQNEMLMIYRLGKWDLPKGKVEKGEDIIAAAKREVTEETNVSVNGIIDHLPSTLHTYHDRKGKRILKTTYWFLMKVRSDLAMRPQVEEGIEKIAWASELDREQYLQNTYQSINEVISQASSRLN